MGQELRLLGILCGIVIHIHKPLIVARIKR